MNNADRLARTLRSQPGFLSCKDVAVLLHVSPATVSRWARAHRLPYVCTLGGHRRYPTDAIAMLVQQLTRLSVELPDGQRQ